MSDLYEEAYFYPMDIYLNNLSQGVQNFWKYFAVTFLELKQISDNYNLNFEH